MEVLSKWISMADGFLWGPPLLILLLGTHLFYTIRKVVVSETKKYLWENRLDENDPACVGR